MPVQERVTPLTLNRRTRTGRHSSHLVAYDARNVGIIPLHCSISVGRHGNNVPERHSAAVNPYDKGKGIVAVGSRVPCAGRYDLRRLEFGKVIAIYIVNVQKYLFRLDDAIYVRYGRGLFRLVYEFIIRRYGYGGEYGYYRYDYKKLDESETVLAVNPESAALPGRA